MKPRVPTPAETRQRTALRSLLAMRRSLDDVDTASLAASFGLSAADVAAEVAKARKARAGALA